LLPQWIDSGCGEYRYRRLLPRNASKRDYFLDLDFGDFSIYPGSVHMSQKPVAGPALLPGGLPTWMKMTLYYKLPP
jgi:hypothetical protein